MVLLSPIDDITSPPADFELHCVCRCSLPISTLSQLLDQVADEVPGTGKAGPTVSLDGSHMRVTMDKSYHGKTQLQAQVAS